MSLVHAAAPTLAVVLSWLSIGAVVAGCGYLVRRGLLSLLSGGSASRPLAADLWIGLVSLGVYLQLWSLVFAINWVAWVGPVAVGIVALAQGLRHNGIVRRSLPRLSFGVLALMGIGTLWVANRALAAAQGYDLGLYHLETIKYELRYPAIPGLGNLQERLGGGDAHLLFVAFLDHGPWAADGVHLANGLLVTMLFFEIGSRFVLRARKPRAPSFTNRVALLLVPATVVVISIHSGMRLSSPSLDFAVFVMVIVGLLYLAETVEYGFQPTAAATSIAMLALAAVTRPLYWFLVVLAIGSMAIAAARLRELTGLQIARLVALATVLPTALLAGFVARQVVLSGYPFFPLTLGGLPVDWRVPAAVVNADNRWVYSWARDPGITPDRVLGSWHWLTAYWLNARSRDLDVIAPLLLLASIVVPSRVSRATRDPARTGRTPAMLALLVPSVAMLAVWFLLAPDPRFALAPIWIAPIAIVAWRLPTAVREFPKVLIVVTALVSALLVEWGDVDVVLMPLIAFAVWSAAWGGMLILRRGNFDYARCPLLHAAVVSAALASVGILVTHGALDPIVADRNGTVGTPREPTAALVAFRTDSGLQLSHPSDGDQCWGALFCTPKPNSQLRLRGTTVSDGLRVSRRATSIGAVGSNH